MLEITLPEDTIHVQTTGYAQGLFSLPGLLALHYPRLTDALEYMPGFPTDAATIEPTARHAAEGLLGKQDTEQLIHTNDPDMFMDIHIQSFLEGYRFSVYALSHGGLDAFMSIPQVLYYATALMFAWSLHHPGDQQGPDETHEGNATQAIREALTALAGLHQQYKALH